MDKLKEDVKRIKKEIPPEGQEGQEPFTEFLDNFYHFSKEGSYLLADTTCMIQVEENHGVKMINEDGTLTYDANNPKHVEIAKKWDRLMGLLNEYEASKNENRENR